MYMGSLLTNIMVSADLSAAKCLDVTCQIRKLVFPTFPCQIRKMFPTSPKHVPNIPLPNKEIGICVWCKGFNGNGIIGVNDV